MKYKKILIPFLIIVMLSVFLFPASAASYGVHADNLYDFFTFAGDHGALHTVEKDYYTNDSSFVRRTDNGVYLGNGDVIGDSIWYSFWDETEFNTLEISIKMTFSVIEHVEENGSYFSDYFGGYLTFYCMSNDSLSTEPNWYDLKPTYIDGVPCYTLEVRETYDTGIWMLGDSDFSFYGFSESTVGVEFVQVGDMEFYYGSIRTDDDPVAPIVLNLFDKISAFISGAVLWASMYLSTIVTNSALFLFVVAIPLIGLGLFLLQRLFGK